ncbi:hypothetical protein V2J09_000793 [Rumex salicifolius]
MKRNVSELFKVDEASEDTDVEEEEEDYHPIASQGIDGNHTDYMSTSPYSGHWPQSYREATDSFTIAASPNLEMLRVVYTPHSSDHDLEGSKIPLLPERSNLGKLLSIQSLLSIASFTAPTAGQCSVTQTVFNGFNIFVGIGLLSMPSTIHEGGWISAAFLLLYAALCFYTGSLLRRCMDKDKNIITFPDLGEAAFGRRGRIFLCVVFYIELYFCCVEFIILEADNLAKLFPNASLTLGGLYVSPVHLLGIIATLIVLPTCYLKDYRIISFFSAGGIFGAFFIVLSLILVGSLEDIGFNQTGPIIKLTGLPYSFGVFGFCYSGHSVLPNLYNSMEDKTKFNNALILIFVLSTSVYLSVGVLGFLLFGEDTDSQITLNLPDDAAVSKLALWVITPLFKYPLLLNPLASCLEELLPSGQSNDYGFVIPLRTTLVVSSVCVAFLVPFFGLVMALAGSFLCMLADHWQPNLVTVVYVSSHTYSVVLWGAFMQECPS